MHHFLPTAEEIDRQMIFPISISIFARGPYRRGETQSAYVNVRIKIHLLSIVSRLVRSSPVDEKPMEIQGKKKNDAERIIVSYSRFPRSREMRSKSKYRYTCVC